MEKIVELQSEVTKGEVGKIFNTKFGQLRINLEKKISFDREILGFSEYRDYVLSSLPGENIASNIKILQSLDEEKLSFLVLPIACDNYNLFGGVIDKQDIVEACEDLRIKSEQLVVLLIVNVRQVSPEVFEAYVNVKAPILIDVDTRKAAQYILSNSKYQISKKL